MAEGQSIISEQEEFEFRRRRERELAASGGSTSRAPSSIAVAGQAAVKGLAGIPDFFLNAPENLWNVGKVVSQTVSRELGKRDPLEHVAFEEPPSPFTRLAAKTGLITPEREPQTMGQRMLDTSIQTGMGMLAAPVKSAGQLVKNVGTGLMSGLASQATKEATGSDLAAVAVGLTTPLAVSAIANAGRTPIKMGAVRKQTLQDAHAVGYVVPPSEIAPTFTGNRLESIAGKAAVGHEAIVRNQQVTNALAVKSLNLPPETPLTMEALKQARKPAEAVYDQVNQLQAPQTMPWFPRFHETNLAEKSKQARADASALYRQYYDKPNPVLLKRAQKLQQTAESIETDIERIAVAVGKPELAEEFREARQFIAKSHDIQDALIIGDGNVSAPYLAHLLDHGRPLTGELNIAARFGQAFKNYAREAAGVKHPGVSGTDAAASALLGVTGAGSMGPLGAAAGGLPLLRGPARNLVLSPGYQSRVMTPPPSPQETRLLGLLAGRGVAGALVPPENLYGR